MADKALSAALEWGRRLFREVLDCALFIRKDLAEAELPGEIRGRIEETCEALVRLEREASEELSALERDLSDSQDSRISALYCFHHLVDRLDREFEPFHALMSILMSMHMDASNQGDYHGAAFAFVTVAGDIQSALGRFRAAVAIVEAEEDNAVPGPGGGEPIAGQAGALRKAPPRLVPRNRYDWVAFVFTCPGCGWSGCGSQTTLGWWFSPGAAYGCPRCRRMIGLVPFPPRKR